MRHIGNLEKRIESLTFYTQLNLLEKKSIEMTAQDPDTGLNLYKEGSFADSFDDIPSLMSDKTPTTLGDMMNLNWKCCYDLDSSSLKCDFHKSPIKIETKSTSGVKLTDDGMLVLNYDESTLIFQKYCTTSYPVNPYNIQINIGSLKLTPPEDIWTETLRIDPNYIDLDTGLTEAISIVTHKIGKIYNDHQVTLTGKREETTPERVSRQVIGIEFGGIGTVNFPPSERLPDRKTLLSKLNKLLKTMGKKPVTKLPHPRRHIYNITRKVATNTLTQTTTASGVTLNVDRESVVQTSMGDKIVQSSLSSYIRENIIKFEAQGLNPNTVVYPFFDGVSVAELCTDSTGLELAGPTGKRLILDGTHKELKTDSKGSITGYFQIPNPNKSTKRFSVGQRLFKLTDVKDDKETSTTRAESNFYAQGLINTVQESIVSTRVPIITSTPFNEPESTSYTIDETMSYTKEGCWYDPVAQTFQVTDHPEGVLISSIDIWFKTKPTQSENPIRLEIRSVTDDESPSIKVLPFSQVTLYPNQIGTIIYTSNNDPVINSPSISGHFDDDESSDGYGSTKFEFSTPVYLQNNTTYAFCLISDSDDYNVWVAKSTPKFGDNLGLVDLSDIILTPEEVKGQPLKNLPFLGTFFKSANAAKWESDQTTDIKFKINKCKFFDSGEIQKSGTATMINSLEGKEFWTDLEPQPIQINQDNISGSGLNLVRIFHENNGFRSGDTVSLYGIVDIEQEIEDSPGHYIYLPINSESIISLTIESVDADSYVVQTPHRWRKTNDETYSGRCGGISVKATQNKKFDILCPFVRDIVPTNTSIGYDLTTTIYSPEPVVPPATPVTETIVERIIIGENIQFNKPQVILVPGGSIEETLTIDCEIQTTKDYISPMIDMATFQCIGVANIINNKDITSYSNNINYFIVSDEKDTTISNANKTIEITLSGVTEADLVEAYNKFVIGKYVRCKKAGAINLSDSKIVSKQMISDDLKIILAVENSAISNDSGTMTIEINDYFVDEISPEKTSAATKYVTIPIGLKNSCNVIKVAISDVYKPENSYIDVYYRIVTVNSRDNILEQPYIKMEPISERNSNSTEDLLEIAYEAFDVPEFTSVSFKIVFRKDENDSSVVPSVGSFIGGFYIDD